MSHWKQITHKFEPRENQQIAIDNAVNGCSNYGFHFLALEMSMGKSKISLNTAEILAYYGALTRILVIRPAGIKGTWKEEIEKHSFLPVPLIWEPSKAKTKKFQREVEEIFKKPISVVVVNLEAFQTKNKVFSEFLKKYCNESSMVILDESSKIKNMTANRTGNLLDHTKDFTFKLALTGTAIEESPLDIFSQMEFLQPNFWYRDKKPKTAWYLFRNKYAIFKEIRLQEGRTIKTVVGTRKTEEIAKKIAPYMTKQKKDDWLDLPEKIFQTIHVDMCKDQEKAYNDFKENLILEYGDEILTAQQATVVLTRLRQLAGGFYPVTGDAIGKLSGIKALVEDVYEYPGKVVIFASFVPEIVGLEQALKKEFGDDQVVTYYGGTKDKEQSLKDFKEHAQFMVLNPQSGAYGINLQFASLMYWYSRPFSYAQNAQGEDRIHRPGQKNTCIYKDIVHSGTVQESKVLKAILDKKNMVNDFERMAMNITIKDILE